MGRKFSSGFFVALWILLMGVGFPAFAQQEEAPRVGDIKAVLARMQDPDPIVRSTVTDEALNQKDPVLRSLALNGALTSEDPLLRAIGFRYLVDVQKEFIVEVLYTDEDLKKIESKNDALINFLLNSKAIHIKAQEYNKDTGVFDDGGKSFQGGSVSQNGINVVNGYPPCKLNLSHVEKEFIVGSLSCGLYSYAARTPLP